MTQIIKPVSELTTAELVAEYNKLTGKETVRFSSRSYGEEKLQRARDAQPKVIPAEKQHADAPPTDEIRSSRKSVTRSRSISESWNRQDVADKRSMRHSCKVDGRLFGSVAEAFRELNLDLAKHIGVRMTMVANGRTEFEGKVFEHVSNE